MISISKVEFVWSESSLFQRTFGGIEPTQSPSWPSAVEATDFLRKMAYGAPKLGYDKTVFRVTWADNQTLECRYDLHHIDQSQENPNGRVDLLDNVRQWLNFCAGFKPHWMDQAKYDACLKLYGMSLEKQQQVRDFISTHQLL